MSDQEHEEMNYAASNIEPADGVQKIKKFGLDPYDCIFKPAKDGRVEITIGIFDDSGKKALASVGTLPVQIRYLTELMLSAADEAESGIPTSAYRQLKTYQSTGELPDDFLTAVLFNNLARVMMHATVQDQKSLPSIVRWCESNLTAHAWGSKRRVEIWSQSSGDAGAAYAACKEEGIQ